MKKMTLSSFNTQSSDYEFGLDYYHGKDIVHTGILLKLDPEYSWERLHHKTRQKINKGKKAGAVIKRVKGTPEQLKQFRTIWFDPEDETLPPHLEPDEIMYLAWWENELVGGVILTPAGKNLYLHNLGSSTKGKAINMQSLLLWHCVEELKDSGYQYIDVGVSFRSNLYEFFIKWTTDNYPIIFEPPFIRPDVRLTPFDGRQVPSYKAPASDEAKATVHKYFGKEITILPRAISAIRILLLHLDIKPDENVAIYKTFNDNDFISRCVTESISSVCKVTRKIDSNTKAAFVIHEFGYPYKEIFDLKDECQKKGIPLIEDCAWSIGSAIDSKHKIGSVGDYAIYSLSKVFDLPYGAVLTGVNIPDEDMWSKYKSLDYFKREIVLANLGVMLPKLQADNDKRRANWHRLAELFAKDGFEPLNELADGVYPGTFMIKLDNYKDVFDRYEKFSVETGRYYHKEALYLPVHQNLTDSQIEYIYAVYRGLLNLCLNFKREK
jgi:perosamine synthetase